VQRGDEVQVTVREGSRLDQLDGLDVTPVAADVPRRSVRRALRGVERVFHLAGLTDLNAPRDRVFSVNLEGTRIVLEEALRADVQRAVYTIGGGDRARPARRHGQRGQRLGGRPLRDFLPRRQARGRDRRAAADRPRTVALALAQAGRRVGAGLPSPTEVRAASLNWAFSSRRAKRELGWSTAAHEDCPEETIDFYRRRDGRRPPPGSRQALPLRLAGGASRRVGR